MKEDGKLRKIAGGGMRDVLNALALLSGLGIQFAAIIVILLYLGSWADKFLHTGNVFKIVGILAGFPCGIYALYLQLKRYRFI